jgi:hypothetical protein
MHRVDAAVSRGLERLAPRWSELGARVASLGAIDAALEDTCAPRRRRISSESMAALELRVARLEGLLNRSDEVPGGSLEWVSSAGSRATWVAGEGTFHVPGWGPIRELSRFDGGASSPSSQLLEASHGLRDAILGAGECGGVPGELPLAWALVQVPAGRVVAHGEVFPETLVCGDLALNP